MRRHPKHPAMKKKWMKSNLLRQIAKYIVVGFINTVLDLAVLNVLIFLDNRGRSGLYFAVFRSISFMCAVVNSYLFNKYWTFKGGAGKTSFQLPVFLFLTLIGMGINLTVSVGVISFARPPAFLLAYWPSIAALAGTAVALFWNFLAYKFVVFKSKHIELEPPV